MLMKNMLAIHHNGGWPVHHCPAAEEEKGSGLVCFPSYLSCEH
jgi:hypothetical protein